MYITPQTGYKYSRQGGDLMKHAIVCVVVVLIVLLVATSCFAGYVSGYTRRDGTYVSGYYRSDPNFTVRDN